MKRYTTLMATAMPVFSLVGGGAVAGAQQGPQPIDTVESSDQSPTASTIQRPAPSDAQLAGGTARTAAADCGSAYDYHKYSATLGFFTVDVFRHTVRTSACEDNVKIVSLNSYQNDCQKYAWGVAYMLDDGFSRAGVGSKSAWGLSTCRVSIGGEVGGVGLQYNKQSNQRHTFTMSGDRATVTKEHWTTTP